MRGSRTSWKSPCNRSRPSSASRAWSPTPRNAAAVEEVDLRAEDDAQIAAELEEEAARKAEEEARAAEEAERKAAEEEAAAAAAAEAERGRREAQAARPAPRGPLPPPVAPAGPLEGTFDHGEEGYGLWLDPAVQDDPIYAEHWAGHRPVEITIEEDQIVIRRAGGGEDDEDGPRRAAAITWRRAQDALPCDCGRAVATRHGPAHAVGPGLLGRELRAGRGRCVRSEPSALVQAADTAARGLPPSQARGRGRGGRRAAATVLRGRRLVADRNAMMLREGPRRRTPTSRRSRCADTRPLRIEWYVSYENDEAAQDGAGATPRTASPRAAGRARSSSAAPAASGRLHHARGGRHRGRDRAALRDARRARRGLGAGSSKARSPRAGTRPPG